MKNYLENLLTNEFVLNYEDNTIVCDDQGFKNLQ